MCRCIACAVNIIASRFANHPGERNRPTLHRIPDCPVDQERISPSSQLDKSRHASLYAPSLTSTAAMNLLQNSVLGERSQERSTKWEIELKRKEDAHIHSETHSGKRGARINK